MSEDAKVEISLKHLERLTSAINQVPSVLADVQSAAARERSVHRDKVRQLERDNKQLELLLTEIRRREDAARERADDLERELEDARLDLVEPLTLDEELDQMALDLMKSPPPSSLSLSLSLVALFALAVVSLLALLSRVQ